MDRPKPAWSGSRAGVAWDVRYFQEEDGSIPAVEFEDSLPKPLAVKLRQFVKATSQATWSLGGGIFEACHGYSNLFEIRAKRGRDLARLFCTVDGDSLIPLGGILKSEGQPTPKTALDEAARRIERYQATKRTV